MTENILAQLNESQRKAVEYCDGPELVIAGAGSGKTRVLTYKIAYLLQKGMNPWNILALTFTNKAANEMKERIGSLVGNSQARELWMGTFHSIFSRILRREAGLLGYTPAFTIYDETDSRSLLKAIIKEMQLDDKAYKPASVHHRISMAKNHLCLAQQYADDRDMLEQDKRANMSEIYRIYSIYQNRLQQANAMDFDDLLTNTFTLFREHQSIREKYAERFQYVLVDEYQDTNYVQQQIVWLLTKESQKVCVVGDDYQSIYGFRGANIDNILDFQKIYKNSQLFKLEQNYRSTQRIVQAANSLMKHNQQQIDKDVYSENEEGEKLLLKPVYSDREEAAVVVKDIQKIKRQEECEYSDFAILYRTNAQSRPFEEEMRKHGIPYRIYGGLSFYQRKEIKDIVAYFRLIVNPNDEEAFKRIVNYPARGIGNATIQKIIESAQQNSMSLWGIINSPSVYKLNFNKGTLSKIDGFRDMITTFIQKLDISDAYELGKEIISVSGINADIYSNSDPEGVSRQENLEEFLNGMNDFVEGRREEGREHEVYLPDFLQEVALLSDLDSDDGETSKVTLMTIHSAKGLEFPTVFIVGMEENIFPSPMAANNLRELEEERRLLYVAITRAERHCILTCAKNRFRYGKMEFDTPSRFLKDIDSRFINIEGASVSDKDSKWERHKRMPWNADDELNAPYPRRSERWQNSRPVAGQFMADPKQKITSPHQPEVAIDPLSESFKQRLSRNGGNLKRVTAAISNGGRKIEDEPSLPNMTSLREGIMIEHQRFGLGRIIKIEGTGENTKATVEFQNTGTKQLLLKFAKFKVIS
ncbi:ATP-dependent helicase [Prevotella sp. KH2C16]|uniref:ATP-dependent helicase n=1 Tax=Prevotella sp. KH2C16 TaxID=1855325 RepID=UPI0008E76FE2|nr:UvrD-helicase domain-containing protein [Prevotella sp. KH2C16]SFG12366.1 DNA helicase-2 / ATP-dependent DNA helicase PcrA [Prevotella sp. KH2C16]